MRVRGSYDAAVEPVEDPIGARDLHATILHLLRLDHRRLIYPRNGLDERLTGVHHPCVVTELLA